MDKTAFFDTARRAAVREVKLADDRVTFVRKLTQAEVSHLTKNYLKDESRQADAFTYVVTKATCTADGARVFGDADQAKVGEIDFDTVKTIADAAIEFSGLGQTKNA